MLKCPAGSDLVLVAAVIAIMLSSDLNATETNILAGLLTAVGDNLAIIAAKKELCEEDETEK